jgi:hypothetical protein
MPSPNRRKFLQTGAMTIALPTGASAQITSRAPQHRATSGDPVHEQFIELAASARKNGNHPFGALLVDGTGHVILTAENTALTTHDPTRHAELNLVQLACGRFHPILLQKRPSTRAPNRALCAVAQFTGQGSHWLSTAAQPRLWAA